MEIINSDQAPQAVGPYSHAVRVGHLLYCSGQIPLDPQTMKIVEGGIRFIGCLLLNVIHLTPRQGLNQQV